MVHIREHRPISYLIGQRVRSAEEHYRKEVGRFARWRNKGLPTQVFLPSGLYAAAAREMGVNPATQHFIAIGDDLEVIDGRMPSEHDHGKANIGIRRGNHEVAYSSSHYFSGLFGETGDSVAAAL